MAASIPTRSRCGRRVAVAFILLLLGAQDGSGWGLAGGPPCEMRGVWLNPKAFESESSRQDTLGKILRANLNTLFLLAPPIGDNHGWSTHEAFGAMIRESRAKGISVHGWIANRFRISGGVDFMSPQEQALQVQWPLELLAKYPALDGVHFDYIRFPAWGDANFRKMESISQIVSLAYRKIQQYHPGKFLTAAVLEATPNRANFAEEYIPGWFASWRKANPGNSYVTQTVPKIDYVPAGFKYQQDPIGWLQGGFVDAIMPMEYTINDLNWQRNIKNWISFRQGDGGRMYIGLGWLKEDGHPDWGYDAPGLIRKIKTGRRAGLKGFVIFEISSFREIDRVLVDALAVDSVANDFDAPFKRPAKSCLANR